MVEKKVLRFLSKLAHLYFKINKCAKFSTDLFWFTNFFIMTDGGRKRKGNTNAGLQPQKIVKLSQFQAISTEKYYTQVFWKDYLAFPVCSRLNFRHGVPGVLRQLVLSNMFHSMSIDYHISSTLEVFVIRKNYHY